MEERNLIYKRKTRSLNKEIVYRQTRHEVNSQHTVMMRDWGKHKRAFCMYNRELGIMQFER